MLKHSRFIIFAAFLSAIFTPTSSLADAPSIFHQPATSTHKLTDLDMRLSPENVEEISIEDIQASSLKPSPVPRSSGRYPLSVALLAQLAVGEHPDNEAGFEVADAIAVSDPGSQLAYFAINYRKLDGNFGFVLIAADTQAPFLTTVVPNFSLVDDLDYMMTGPNRIVAKANAQHAVSTIDMGRIRLDLLTPEDFAVAKTMALEQPDVFHSFQTLENQLGLNHAFGVASQAHVFEQKAGATYDGQDPDGGYGGIHTPSQYLADRYGGTWQLKSSQTLAMASFTMQNIDDLAPSTNHCVPTAITRAFNYEYWQGFTRISSSSLQLFKEVKSVASIYGYSASSGTPLFDIESIIERVGDDQGYPNTDSKWIGLFSWSATIKSSIAEDEPLLHTIFGGYYNKHTVTVSGWREYVSDSGKLSRMLTIWDGWQSTRRYIDYDALVSNLGVVSSFHTVEVQL